MKRIINASKQHGLINLLRILKLRIKTSIVIASNAALSIPTDLEKESFFIESNFIDKLTAQFKSLSIRYKVGYAVLSPLRILKNIFVKPGK